MRALITGGRGFVGHWLATHLEAAGDDVTVVDLEVDVTDAAATRTFVGELAPDALYHLAALTHVGESWSDPLRVDEVNIMGTASVLAAARACQRPPTVLFVSSAEVYGAVTDPGVLPLSETYPPAPLSPYAASKLAAEVLVLQAHRAYGQPTLVVRPFNHVGPGQSPNFAVAALAKRIVDAQAEGRSSIPVGNLGASRDFTDVRDVVRAYRLLVERGSRGEVYNVCSGVDVTIESVANQLAELAGADVKLETDPDLVRPVEVPVMRGDPTKLRRDTGWAPEIPLARTLADTLDHWRAARAS